MLVAGAMLKPRSRVVGACLTAAGAVVALAVAPALVASSGYALVAVNLAGTLTAWKGVSAALGTPAPHQTGSAWLLLVYVASPVPFLADSTDCTKPARAGRSVRGLLSRVCALCGPAALLSLLLSLGVGASASPFGQGRARALVGAYAEVWLVFLGVSVAADVGGLVLYCLDLSPLQCFRAPLLKSASPFEMWSRRWNMGVRGLLHETVYLPLRKFHAPRWLASATAFFASGLLHECMISRTDAAKDHRGAQLLFFLSQLPFVLAGGSQKFDDLDRVHALRGWLTTNACLLPLSPLFVGSLRATGLWTDLAQIAPTFKLLS